MKRILLALMLGLGFTAQADDDPLKILKCMRANVPTALAARVQDVRLTVTDRSGGTRLITGKLYGVQETSGKQPLGLVRTTLRINAPDNLKGAAFLIREARQYAEQGMYVYLPSVRRVRRISGTFADGALLGTDFTYNDFRLMQNAFGDQLPSLEATEKIEGRDSFVLSFKPGDKQPLGYSQVRAWVDQKTCVALKLEFYQGKALQKQLLAPSTGLKQTGSYWYSSLLEMTDFTVGSKSELQIIDAKSDGKLPKKIFDPAAFYKGG